MAHTSPRFNFDDFDAQIEEALLEYGEVADSIRPALEPLPNGAKRPGELGGVAVQLSFADRLSDHPRLFDPDLLDEPAGGSETVANYERALGRALRLGEITAAEALGALSRFEEER